MPIYECSCRACRSTVVQRLAALPGIPKPGRCRLLCLLALGLLMQLSACSATRPAADPRFRAAALGPGDDVAFQDSADDVIIDVTSERGIGSVEIARLGPPPKTLTLNLHLKGLEELRFSWGDAQVFVHVASDSGGVREEVELQGGEAAAIDRTSPYWMPVRIVAENQEIPLENGSIAIAAPPAFLAEGPQRFALRWIDFYRSR